MEDSSNLNEKHVEEEEEEEEEDEEEEEEGKPLKYSYV